jgi:hypothetical protein
MSDKDQGKASLDAAKPKGRRGASPDGDKGKDAEPDSGFELASSRQAASSVTGADLRAGPGSEPAPRIESRPELAHPSADPPREQTQPAGTTAHDVVVNSPDGPAAQGEPLSQTGRAEAPEQAWGDRGGAAAPRQEPPFAPNSGRGMALAALLLAVLLPGALLAYLSASGVFNGDSERVSRLESAVTTLRAAPAPKVEVTRGDLDKLAARLDQLDKAFGTLAQRPVETGQGGDAREATEQAKKAAESAASAQSAATKVEQLESKIADMERQLAALEQTAAGHQKPASNAPSMLILARTITNDLPTGVPYAGELDALARLGADAKLVEALKPFAEKGAPSPSSLGSDFRGELAAARAKVAGSAAPTGWWERVTGMLGQFIRVRDVGGEEPGSPAAPVEAALARGDLAAAADAWASLPVFEKSATAVSGARIKALAAAYDAARRLSDQALEAIRRTGSAENGG